MRSPADGARPRSWKEVEKHRHARLGFEKRHQHAWRATVRPASGRLRGRRLAQRLPPRSSASWWSAFGSAIWLRERAAARMVRNDLDAGFGQVAGERRGGGFMPSLASAIQGRNQMLQYRDVRLPSIVSHGSPLRSCASASVASILFRQRNVATGTPESAMRSQVFLASRSTRCQKVGSSFSTASRLCPWKLRPVVTSIMHSAQRGRTGTHPCLYGREE